MKLNRIIKYILIFLLFNLLQIFWAKDFALFGVAFCFMYIAFILSLPLSMSVPIYLLMAFLNGVLVDMFYDTLGMHAAACVAVAYLRSYIIQIMTPLGGYDDVEEISIEAMGPQWYVIYTLILVFIHHFILFFIEAGGISHFINTFSKIIFTTGLSTFMISAFNYIFFTKTARRR